METAGAILAKSMPGTMKAAGFPALNRNQAENEDSVSTLIESAIARIRKSITDHADDPVIEADVEKPEKCPFGGCGYDYYECRYCAESVNLSDGIRQDEDHRNHVKYRYRVGRCYSIVRYRQLLDKSRLKGVHLKHTFKSAKIDANNRKLYEDLKKWNPLSGEGIYITVNATDDKNPQGNGTGKTYAMCALAHKLCWEGVACFMASTIEFLTELKATYGESAQEEEIRILDKYINIPVLLWDDMGKESIRKDSEWVPQMIYHVINERVSHGRPMVISSNFSILELESRFGDSNHGPAIVSRLVGHCKEHYYELGGPDRRAL